MLAEVNDIILKEEGVRDREREREAELELNMKGNFMYFVISTYQTNKLYMKEYISFMNNVKALG